MIIEVMGKICFRKFLKILVLAKKISQKFMYEYMKLNIFDSTRACLLKSQILAPGVRNNLSSITTVYSHNHKIGIFHNSEIFSDKDNISLTHLTFNNAKI